MPRGRDISDESALAYQPEAKGFNATPRNYMQFFAITGSRSPVLATRTCRGLSLLVDGNLDHTRIAVWFGDRFLCDGFCFKPDMIVRQANETARRAPKLLHFALPIQPREGRITVRQVRRTGLGLFLLSAWFLLVAIMSILGL